jgi:hypothetical protein
VTAIASGGVVNNYGVENYSASPTLTNMTASASGGTNSYGVANYSLSSISSPLMKNVIASATGGINNYGLYNYKSSPVVQESVLRTSGGTINYGIYNGSASGSYTVTINNSTVVGSTNTIYNTSSYDMRIGASLLDGGAVVSGDMLICAGVYDENYTFYASTCP